MSKRPPRTDHHSSSLHSLHLRSRQSSTLNHSRSASLLPTFALSISVSLCPLPPGFIAYRACLVGCLSSSSPSTERPRLTRRPRSTSTTCSNTHAHRTGLLLLLVCSSSIRIFLRYCAALFPRLRRPVKPVTPSERLVEIWLSRWTIIASVRFCAPMLPLPLHLFPYVSHYPPVASCAIPHHTRHVPLKAQPAMGVALLFHLQSSRLAPWTP